MPSAATLHIEHFFDPDTGTLSYLVLDPATYQCALVDSVLGYDPKSGRTSHAPADRLIARVRELGATVAWILETHVHADHLTAAPYLQQQLGGRIGIGNRITRVQQVFGALFNAGEGFASDGRQFDHLFEDGEAFQVGKLQVEAMHTPGHTPACMTYVVRSGPGEDADIAAFVGDTLFMPDYGTARCDFPGGDAHTLFRSIRRVLALPPRTRLYMCHDYQPGGRPLQWVSTVAEQRTHNVHVHDGIDEDHFVAMRRARDATLAMPVLILPSVQVNMRAGHLPEPEADGRRYLKIPVDAL
ncbi:MAG: MBL fold metallo-hydrolase [Gammaproteobacteria bacterium]|uniref:MBL fold metallo-hydrolase n=1 Tax=Pseudacidovorax sp. 1753 TaxID=3156419 RepID=UPI003391D67C